VYAYAVTEFGNVFFLLDLPQFGYVVLAHWSEVF
jgi:hypothetical protein